MSYEASPALRASNIYLGPVESPTLKVFSLNTCFSGSKYGLFENILDFIYRTKPDVVLLQEVYKGSLERIQNALGGRQVAFSPMCRLSLTEREEDADYFGVAIGSRHRLSGIQEDYYHGGREDSDTLVLNGQVYSTSSLLQATLRVGSARFNFGTTQFTWVRGARPSVEQRQDFTSLAPILDKTPDLVLTGDLNSPRGYSIFNRLAKRFRDNIPPEVKSTLDPGVRPKAIWQYVVDGFFTSGHYWAKVEMISGLSDHLGILAEVRRVAI